MLPCGPDDTPEAQAEFQQTFQARWSDYLLPVAYVLGDPDKYLTLDKLLVHRLADEMGFQPTILEASQIDVGLQQVIRAAARQPDITAGSWGWWNAAADVHFLWGGDGRHGLLSLRPVRDRASCLAGPRSVRADEQDCRRYHRAIVLWGNPSFAEPGSTMRMTFEAGPSIDLVSVGVSWREWDLGGGKQTAEVFRVAKDPGELLNGNTLCGDDVTFMAFFEGDLMPGTRMLQLAAFSGEDVPEDINSDGLCATFNYEIE